MIKANHLFVFLILVVASCKTQQPVVTNTPVKATVDTTKQIVIKDSVIVPAQKYFHISLLLPLSLNKQFETDSAGNDLEILPSSLQALNFYEGFLLSIDTSKNNKNPIRYTVYDADRDSISLWKLLNSEAVSKSDLVMAMLPPSWNLLAAKISSIREYELFLLQGNNSNCLVDNGKTFLVAPNNSTQCKLMSAYLNSTFSGSTFLIINRDLNKKETELANLFFTELDSLTNHNSVLKVKGEFNDIKTKLVKSKQNILLIPSSDESYLSSLLNKLSDLKDYRITIAGLPTWEHFESIDPTLLETFKTHIFNASYIDYKKESVKQFRKQFIESYHADPSYSAFQAHDLINWIQSNSKNSYSELDHFKTISSITLSEFKPVRISGNCGFENYSISILKFNDGLLEKVNH